MSVKTGKVQMLAAVPDKSGCTNFGRMAISGLQAWGVKTNAEQTLSTLYYCNNVDRQARQISQAKNLLGHGNAMTLDRHFLYFGCWISHAPAKKQNRHILRVPRDFNGDWSKGIKIRTPSDVIAFSYYGKGQIIARVGSDVPGYLKFAVGKIAIAADQKSGSITYQSYLYVKLDTKNVLSQDIFYDLKKRLLFIPLVRNNMLGQLTLNSIYIVDLAGKHTIRNGSHAFAPRDTIVINMGIRSGFTKFEIESLGLDSSRRIVFSANVEGKTGDHFFRITNLNF